VLYRAVDGEVAGGTGLGSGEGAGVVAHDADGGQPPAAPVAHRGTEAAPVCGASRRHRRLRYHSVPCPQGPATTQMEGRG